MKKTHIVLIIFSAILVGSIMWTYFDASTYANFELADNNKGQTFTVVGYLDKEADMNFDARKSIFTFTAIDKAGEKKVVLYNQPKPTDFERSEEITMKGVSTDSVFVASEILMKCPSKYNEQNQMAGSNNSYTE